MDKPNRSNLWLSSHQATGLSEHHHQRDYVTHFSQEEPTLFPLEFYDDYPEDAVLNCFKQLNQFIRTNAKAAAFDGKVVSFDIQLPEGLHYEDAKQIFIAQGFAIPTVANWLSGSKVLTISWENHIVPEEEKHLLEKSGEAAVHQITNAGKENRM